LRAKGLNGLVKGAAPVRIVSHKPQLENLMLELIGKDEDLGCCELIREASSLEVLEFTECALPRLIIDAPLVDTVHSAGLRSPCIASSKRLSWNFSTWSAMFLPFAEN
jgi:hypothetical protein